MHALSAERVRVRPPRQRISASCSLAAERRPGAAADGSDVVPIRCVELSAADKWVRSCAVDVLERAALHRLEHVLIPSKLELAIALVDPSRRGMPHRDSKTNHSLSPTVSLKDHTWPSLVRTADPALDRSTSCPLDQSVASAIASGALRYTASEGDDSSAAALRTCTEHLVHQVRAMMDILVGRARSSGYPVDAALLKKLVLCLSGFWSADRVRDQHGTVDIRRALGASHAPTHAAAPSAVARGEPPPALGEPPPARGELPAAQGAVPSRAGHRVQGTGHRVPSQAGMRPEDTQLMPPPPPKRPRQHALAPNGAPDADEEQGAQQRAWFVSVRVEPLSGECPTQGSSAAACDAMQRRVLAAMGAHLPRTADGTCSACPVLPDHTVTLIPSVVGALAESHVSALVAALHDETDDVEFGNVGVGVASNAAVAMLAASTALRAHPADSVRWARTTDDVNNLLGERPCLALVPTLYPTEVVALARANIRTCAQLTAVGAIALGARFGAARARWLMQAAASPVPSRQLIEDISAAGGVPPPRAIRERAAGGDGTSEPPRDALSRRDAPVGGSSVVRADEGAGDPIWVDLPSFSQTDQSVISEIGGEVGAQIRREYEKTRRDRDASEAAARAAQGGAPSAARAPSFSAADGGVGAATTAADDEEVSWACAECTFKHGPVQASYLVCEMCGTQRLKASTGAGTSVNAHASGGGGAAGESHPLGIRVTSPLRIRYAPVTYPLPEQRSPPAARGGRGRQGRAGGRARGAVRGSASRGVVRPVPRRSPFDNAWSAPTSEGGGEAAGRARSLGFGQVDATLDAGSWMNECNQSASVLHDDATVTAQRGAAMDAPPTLEPWSAVQEYLVAWLEREAQPDPAPLLAYARALVDDARLDELGCLAKQVERSCASRADCVPLLHTFVDVVDRMVRESYGGRFHPLLGMRSLLAQLEEGATA